MYYTLCCTVTSQTRTLTHTTHTHTRDNFLPAQHTQNEIENEKGAEDDERDKIDPRQLIAHSILHLRESRERERRGGETERRVNTGGHMRTVGESEENKGTNGVGWSGGGEERAGNKKREQCLLERVAKETCEFKSAVMCKCV